MFVACCSSVHLLEAVAVMCHLPSHSYVREVGGDGSLLGGVELEIDVVRDGAMPARFFFWSCVCAFRRTSDSSWAPARGQEERGKQTSDVTSEFTVSAGHVSTKQGQNILKRKTPESPDSGSVFSENAALPTLDIRGVSNMTGQALHDGRRTEYEVEERKQVTYRECYVSLAQNNARETCSIHFPLVAKRCSAGDGQSLPLLVKSTQPVLCESGMINIHASSDEETIFSITDERDARLTYDILTAAEHAMVAGIKISFKQWKPTDEFGFDVAEQRVCVSIGNLPLQLWSAAAIEHILSPYCALEFVSGSTRRRTNLLQNYRCIAWAQSKIPIPTSILVCIPVTIPDEGQLMDTQTYRRVLAYQISLDLQRYIHRDMGSADYIPVAHVPWSEQGYTTGNAICYMPPHLVDREFMQQLSNSIVTAYKPECVQDICAELQLLYPDITIDIKPINQTQQIILLPPGRIGTLVQQSILSTSVSGMSGIQPWSAAAGSTERLLRVCARVTLSRVPAHFCTSKLMHLFLGGCAYMEIPDSNAERIMTSERYRCIVWCHDVKDIPQNILAKVVSPDIAAALLLHDDSDVTLRTSKMQIEIQHTASCIQAVLDM